MKIFSTVTFAMLFLACGRMPNETGSIDSSGKRTKDIVTLPAVDEADVALKRSLTLALAPVAKDPSAYCEKVASVLTRLKITPAKDAMLAVEQLQEVIRETRATAQLQNLRDLFIQAQLWPAR